MHPPGAGGRTVPACAGTVRVQQECSTAYEQVGVIDVTPRVSSSRFGIGSVDWKMSPVSSFLKYVAFRRLYARRSTRRCALSASSEYRFSYSTASIAAAFVAGT